MHLRLPEPGTACPARHAGAPAGRSAAEDPFLLAPLRNAELSLLRVRGVPVRYAPDMAARSGLSADDAATLADEELLVEDHENVDQDVDVDGGKG